MPTRLIAVDYIQNTPDMVRGRHHQHDHHETLLVRSGTYRATTTDGETVLAAPGSLLTWPAGLVHHPNHQVDGRLHLLICYWRGRLPGPPALIRLADDKGRLSFLMEWLWSLQPLESTADERHCNRVFRLWVAELQEQMAAASRSPRNSRIDHIQTYLIQNLHRAVDLGEVARTIPCSKEHMIRQFKAETGMTPYRFLQRQRVLKATQLLLSTNQSFQEVAEAVGYQSSSQLHSLVKRETGRTPGQWRSN